MRNEDELCGVAELGPALGRGIRRRNMRTDHNWEKEKNNMKPKENIKEQRVLGLLSLGKQAMMREANQSEKYNRIYMYAVGGASSLLHVHTRSIQNTRRELQKGKRVRTA